MESWLPSILMIAYGIILVAIAYHPKIRTTVNMEDYFVAGRTFSYLVLNFTVAATTYSGYALMGTPGFWYSKGIAAFFIWTYLSFLYIVFYMVGPRIWEVGKKHGYATQADLLGGRFDSNLLRGISAITGFLLMFPYIAVGFIACAYVINILTYGAVPYAIGGLLIVVVTIIYLWVGGLKAVGWTDVVQGAVMIVALIGSGYLVVSHYYPGTTALFDAIIAKAPERLSITKSYSWPMYTSMILMMMWGFISWPHLFNRAYAAKSIRVIKITSAIGPLGSFIAYAPMMLAAFAILTASTYKFEAPDKALLTELGHIAPIWFFAIVGVGALASAMSTVDSQAHVAGVIIARDIIQKIFSRGAADEKKIVNVCRYIIIAGLLGSYLIALYPPKLMWNILIAAYAGVSQLVPPIMAALYWKRATKQGAATGLIAGLVIALLFSYVWPHPLGIHAGAWGMIVNAILLVAVSYGTEPPLEETVREFYE